MYCFFCGIGAGKVSLGMTFRVGGHMFRPLLLPDKPLSNGKTIWEAHPEWYGLPESGVREKARVLNPFMTAVHINLNAVTLFNLRN